MELYFSQKEILYILNCINITLSFLKHHTRDEKNLLQFYFDFKEYDENYNNLLIMHRLISLKANKHFYNIDDIFFTIERRNEKKLPKYIDNLKNIV